MPIYLIRLAQAHESFRKVELQALADLAGVKVDFVKYEEDVGNSFRSFILALPTCVHVIILCFPTMLALFYLSDYTGPDFHSHHTAL
jgi:tRNA G10  N-methylase Trm11